MGYLCILIFALGAIWRRGRGEGGKFMGKHITGWNILPFALILPVAIFDWQLGLAFFIAWLSLVDGFNGWEDFGHMAKRYTFYSMAACLFLGLSQWYLLFGFIAGICYPIGDLIHKKYNNFKYTEYCEYLAGGLMFSGALYFYL